MIFEAKKDKLIHSDKIEIRKSDVHGYGVFAKEFIKKGEILEECHLIEVLAADQNDYTKLQGDLSYYVFTWPRPDMDEIISGDFGPSDIKKIVIPTGFGLVYNSSKDAYGANANWIDTGENIFIFKAVKNINKDDEILINYSQFLYNRKLDINEKLYRWWYNMNRMDKTNLKRTKPKI